MIMVRLMGGMGNQMFQYAFGRYLAERNGTQLKMDKTLLLDRTPRPNAVFRNYDLDIFQIKEEFATEEEVQRFNGVPQANLLGKFKNRWRRAFGPERLVVQEGHHFDPDHLMLGDETCVVGRWQSERYFAPIADQIRAEFSFRNPLDEAAQRMATHIESCAAVCLNVRRADYVSNATYSQRLGAIPLSFYEQAVALIKEKVTSPELFVFSDDVAWCAENLHFDLPTTLVTHEVKGPKFQYYLNLMTRCQHFIIPNSTFAWWAAWLAPNSSKMVVAPTKWAIDASAAPPFIHPDDWILL